MLLCPELRLHPLSLSTLMLSFSFMALNTLYLSTYIPDLSPALLTQVSNGLLNFSTWKSYASHTGSLLAFPIPIDDNSVQCFKRKPWSHLWLLSFSQIPHSFLLVGLYSNYIQNLIIFHYDGVQDTLSENTAHWHMEYFKLKEFEKQQK